MSIQKLDSLGRPIQNAWTDEEEKLLTENARTSEKEIVKLFPNRTLVAIRAKKKKMGLSKIGKLDEKDKQFIRDNWDTMKSKDIAEHLDISVSTVNRHVKKLGFNKKTHEWELTDVSSKIVNGQDSIRFIFEMKKEL